MKVTDIMSREPTCCSPDDTLERPAQIMWEQDCGCVPVIEGDGRVVGMITDRDCCMAAYTRGTTLGNIPVGDVMSREVQCTTPDEGVEQAERRMQSHQIRRMPVVQDGRIIGLVSLNDIALAADRAAERGEPPRAGDVASTLAAISQHRRQRGSAAPAE